MNPTRTFDADQPFAERELPVYEALALDIKSRGIESVFGLMSDDAALFVTTLDAIGVRFHATRHENSAVAMAEGYASATGRLGVAIIGRGPATANALHGCAYAQRTGSRVLLVFGASSVAHQANGAAEPDAKEFNATGVLEAMGIKTYVANDAGSARATLAHAVQATGQGGCVALLLPMNVQFQSIAYPGAMGIPAPAPTANPQRIAARPAAIGAAVALLAHSRRPLIVAGLGAHRAGARKALEALADKIGAVLATSLKAKDMFHGNAYNLGVVGSYSHTTARRLIDQADCVIVFGAGLNQKTTSYGTSLPTDAALIQVDLSHAKIGRWYHADLSLIADAREAAEQLCAALPARADSDKAFYTADTRERLTRVDMAAEFQAANTDRTMDPRSVALELDRMLPASRNAVYDAGNFLQVMPYISGLGPEHNKNTADFASVGMGFGTAMGIACATPERSTVLFVGDGGFLMTMSELETVAREGIALVIIVLNDAAYGAELHYLKMRNMPVAAAVFSDIDFAPIAAGFGFETATARTLSELRALAPMLSNPQGPILIDCKINAAVAAPFMLETADHEKRLP